MACDAHYDECTDDGYPREDPYQAEIHDEHVIRVLCDNCYRGLCEEV